MSKTSEIGKRGISFWKSDSPLTSKRVSVMLSHPKTSTALAKTVRQLRHSSHIKTETKVHSFKADY